MRIRSLFSAALSAALVLGGALPASASFAASPAAAEGPKAESPTDDVAAAAPQPSLTIAPADPVLANMKATLELSVLVSNPTAAAIAAGSVQFELSDEPVKRAADLASGEGLSFTPFGDLGVAETPAASDEQPGEHRGSLDVTPDDLGFTDSTAPGTYLVRAQLTTEGEQEPLVSATTPVVWRGAGTSKAPLSIIVPFVLPANIHTMPTRAQLSDLTPGWDRLLTAAEAARATLALDPRIIAGIRSYGVEAPAPAREFLTRLEASTSPSFLLQFADADPAAQAALGFTSLIGPTSLQFVTRFGTFEAPADEIAADEAAADGTAGSGSPDAAAGSGSGAAKATPAGAAGLADAAGTDPTTAEGSPTADGEPATDDELTTDGEPDPAPEDDQEPVEVAPPTLSELMSWHGDSAAWPAEGNVDQGTLDLLTRSNIRAFVLDSSNVKQRGGPRIMLPEGEAVITDAGLSEAATRALANDSEVDRAAALAEIAGALAVRAQSGEDGVVIGLSRAAVADADDPESLLDALAALDFVRATRVADQTEGTGSLRAAGPLEPRLALLRSAANREASVNEVGAVLEHPQYLSGYQRTRLLELFATRYAAPDSGFDAASEKFRARDSELLEGVQVISTDHTQLVGVSTSVPVQLHNSLPFDARVTLVAVPVSAAIEVEQREFADVIVEAEANERVLVPVRSRVSSGESGLVVTVSAPSGEPTVFTGTMPLSISSTVETVALWLLGVSAAFLFVVGVIRSVRKKRKAAALSESAPVQSSAE